jgi:hypothetical protein
MALRKMSAFFFKSGAVEGCMAGPPTGGRNYVCPMHSSVRQPNPGKCPECGMDLLPEGTRFAMLRHMTSKPLHRIVMAAVMLIVVVAAMMMVMRRGF